MLPEIIFEMPTHKLFPPRHPKIAEAEKVLEKFLSDPRERLALSFHEGAHAVQFGKLGIEYAFGGPSVTHDCPTDTYSISFGTTQVRDRDYLKLAAEHPERLAKVLVAGRVAEAVLMGRVDPRTSESDFLDFLQFAKGKSKAELILLWKAAEEAYLRELSADLNQQKEIIREAAKYSDQIFGLDQSVREKSPVQATI